MMLSQKESMDDTSHLFKAPTFTPCLPKVDSGDNTPQPLMSNLQT